MANDGRTTVAGTVVEVRKKGDTAWEKFVCNEGVLDIQYGKYDTDDCTPIETGVTDSKPTVRKYSDVNFDYKWTQALTSNADKIIKEAYLGKHEVEFRQTMANATGNEATGTTFVQSFIVLDYTHKGEKASVWTTNITVKPTGEPVETAAA